MDKDEEYISYRVNTVNKYTVFKSSYGGKDYYKIQLEKKQQDGSKLKFYRNLKFVHCEPPQDRDVIRIRKAFENFHRTIEENENLDFGDESLPF